MSAQNTPTETTTPIANEGCLSRLVRQHSESRKQLEDALKVAYPEGMQVAFMRSSVQVNPSFGVVTGTWVDNHPYVLVKCNGKRGAWVSLDMMLTRPSTEGQTRGGSRVV